MARGGACEGSQRPLTGQVTASVLAQLHGPSWGCWASPRAHVVLEWFYQHGGNQSNYEETKTKWSEETFSSFRCNGVFRSSEI